jgi:hypothetical protein
MSSLEKAEALNPQYANTFYSKAVCSVLSGEVDRGLEYLEKTVGLNGRYRDTARTDPDFYDLWEDDWFREIIQR